MSTLNPVSLHPQSSTQHDITNSRNNLQYRLQISYPLNWERSKSLRQSTGFPVLYILDGNALFLTATEACWRREIFPFYSGGGIVVAIGYPLDYSTHQSLYDVKRRAFDLTPSKIKNIEGYDVGGGADQFLEFIGTEVRDLVKRELEKRGVKIEREALFGHSFGGLCAVHAMFSESLEISTFFACSPSIWWNDRDILEEEEDFRKRSSRVNDKSKPSLYISFGSLEEEARQMPGETGEEFEKRKEATIKRAMCRNAREMYERLLKSGKLGDMSITEFEDEDHGTVAPSALNRCISKFFEY